jgi:hypothetical protein
MSDLLRCTSCAGQVVWDVAKREAACVFCGATTLEEVVRTEEIPAPEAALLRVVPPEKAEAAYRAWARASFWRPAELRALSVRLQAMYLPGWSFDSTADSHWAGLQPAPTRSGKRPVTGHDVLRLRHTIPASGGVTPRELTALLPFDESRSGPWSAAEQELPFEPPAVSQRAAALQAHAAMSRGHAAHIARSHGLTSCNVASTWMDHDVRLRMLPIYIGAYRFRGRPWRFLVNGQTGEVFGDAPVDRVKVALVILASVVVLASLAAFLGR